MLGGDAPGRKAVSEWERLARERSMQEQAMLREERENLRMTLQTVDPSVAVTVQKHLEICATAIAQLRQDDVELRRLIEDARTMTKHLGDIESLQVASAMLESSQMKMASEVQALRLEVNQLKEQVKGVGQEQKLITSTNNVGAVSCYQAYQADGSAAASQQHDPDIFVMGGFNGKSWIQTTEYYCSKSWQPSIAASMLVSRSYAAASVLNDCIYVFGGGDGKNNWFNTVERYDYDNDCWKSCSPMGNKRGSLAGVTLGDRIFAIGGGNGQVQFSEVECYDAVLGTWIPSTSMLEKRYMVAACELGGAIYAVGGFDGKHYLKTMERFDPREALWTRMPSMTSKRGSLSAAVLNGKLYALGGFDGSGFLATVEAFDPRAGRWDSVSPMSCPRAYGAAVTVRDEIHVIGGLETKIVLCDGVEVYQEISGWKKLNVPGFGKRSFLTAAVL